MTSSEQGGEKLNGSTACPICGLDSPHHHTKLEIARHRYPIEEHAHAPALGLGGDPCFMVKTGDNPLTGWHVFQTREGAERFVDSLA